jgi:O-antigen ligase
VETWSLTLFECLIFAFGAAWFVKGLVSDSWELQQRALLIPLLLIVAYALLQTLPIIRSMDGAGIEGAARRSFSADPVETRRFAVKLLSLILMGQLLLHYTSTTRRLRVLVYMMIGLGVSSALFGIARQAMQGANGFFLPYLVPNTGYGQFINKNHFAFLMEMPLGLLLGLIVGGGVRRERIPLHLAAAIPLGGALILSNSRGGILAMLCQMLFLALMFTLVRHRRRTGNEGEASSRLMIFSRPFILRLALILSVVVLVALSVVWIGGEPVVSNLGAATRDFNSRFDNANISRRYLWTATWQLIKAHPVAGIGFGGYWMAITEYHDGSGAFVPQQAHNDYLELVASGGIIGAALGIWFLAGLIRSVRGPLRSSDSFRRAACLGALSGLFAVAVHSIFDFGLHITINALVCTALVVIATASSTRLEAAHTARVRVRRRVKTSEETLESTPRAEQLEVN